VNNGQAISKSEKDVDKTSLQYKQLTLVHFHTHTHTHNLILQDSLTRKRDNAR